ncbi:MAG: MlaD family protein [Verrucomicrobiota bacterium]
MNEQRTVDETTPERTQRVVGVFVVVALLLLLAGFGYYLYHLSERRGWRVPRCPYFTFVQTADGLEVGAPVKLMGFDVGAITVIEAEPPGAYYNVFVGVEIKRPYYGYILSDSKIKVVNVGLMGRQLEVTKGLTGVPTVTDRLNRPHEVLVNSQMVALTLAPKGVFLQPDESAGVTERAEKLLNQVEGALPNILALTNRLNVVLDNANILVTNSATLMASLDRTTAQLAPVLSNATLITGNLTNPTGSLGDWLITTNLSAQINELVFGLNATLLNLASITGNLNSQVQSNDQILTGISTLVVDTDNLVQGLKKHWLLRGAFPATNAPAKKSTP